jgi:hypothetical protein
MTAWLERNKQLCFRKKALIHFGHRKNSISLSVLLSIFPVKSFTYDPSIIHNYRTHQRVGRDGTSAMPGKIKAPAHIYFVL